MQGFVYDMLENAALYIPLGLFFIGVLFLQGIITVIAQKRNEKFQRTLMEEEARKTAAILNQTAIMERQALALETLVQKLDAKED